MSTSSPVSLEWEALFAEVMALEKSAIEPETSDGCHRDSASLLPFEDVLIPFVAVARARLKDRVGHKRSLLSETAHLTLERSLLESLSTYAAPSLYLEFTIQRTITYSPLDQLVAATLNNSQQILYKRFVHQVWDRWQDSFWTMYAPLARTLSLVTVAWVESIDEFLFRLLADQCALQQTFGGERRLGQVLSVEPALSDPHGGGRQVMSLTFEGEQQIVYKPRPVGVEAAFMRLIDFLNAQGTPLALKSVKLLDAGTYGWMEHVGHRPCKSEGELRHYYARTGMLLCLLYVLEAVDCHAGNLIALGDQPILVDLECLLHPRIEARNVGIGEHALNLAQQFLQDSVLRTGLLPQWTIEHNADLAYDMSGLGGDGGQATPHQVTIWQHVNTDCMKLSYVQGCLSFQANLPTLYETNADAVTYVEEIVEGFRQMYMFLLSRQRLLLAPRSPLYELAHCSVRVILRSTNAYQALLLISLNPRNMRGESECRTVWQGLLEERNASNPQLHCMRSVSAEVDALDRGDIPVFRTLASSRNLEVGLGQVVAGCFSRSGFERALEKIENLSVTTMEQQVKLIYSALSTHATTDRIAVIPRSIPLNRANIDLEEVSGPRQTLLDQAVRIGEQIRQQAFVSTVDGSAAWLVPRYLPARERYRVQAAGHDLYSGSCGIALFLAALHRATHQVAYRELALGALRPLQAALCRMDTHLATQMGLGGGVGVGSVIYSLVVTAHLIDDRSLLDYAQSASTQILVDTIRSDRSLDILSGSAGAAIGLLKLYTALPGQAAVLEKAVACGMHLVESRTRSKTGYRSWRSHNGIHLTGFSHGAAGIAYALLRLYAATDDPLFYAAAEEAIEYERSVFDPEAGNWPDFRQTDRLAFMSSWCHGGPGIGLARAGGLKWIDSETVRNDIDAALQTTRYALTQNPPHLDHLCCGSAGLIETVYTLGQILGREDLITFADCIALQVIERAEKKGGYSLDSTKTEAIDNPGFFAGTSGIGYTFLRLAFPNLMPAISLWE